MSALALYCLIADGEQGAEVYSVANDIQQASILANEAFAMVEQSPSLLKRLELVKSTKRIVYPKNRSVYRALSSEKSGKHGYNPSVVIYDEVAFARDRELWDILRYGFATRKQPLLITISTAGYDREGIGYEQYQYAKKVRDNVITDPHFLPLIFEADPQGDYRDKWQWEKANPSTFAIKDMSEVIAEVQAEPRKEANARILRLNQWWGNAESWLSTPLWDSCNQPFELDILDGRDCYVGLDLA